MPWCPIGTEAGLCVLSQRNSDTMAFILTHLSMFFSQRPSSKAEKREEFEEQTKSAIIIFISWNGRNSGIRKKNYNIYFNSHNLIFIEEKVQLIFWRRMQHRCIHAILRSLKPPPEIPFLLFFFEVPCEEKAL